MRARSRRTILSAIVRRLAEMLLLLLGSSAHESHRTSPDRIVGGATIDISEVPFMLSYRLNDQHVCGATIIGEEWGLTAAHCVAPFVDIPGIEVSVRSGSSKYDYGGTIHNVTYMAYHEKYNDDDNDYDVAVIKVTPPFRYSDVTKPAKLPNLSRTIDASVGLVCGWGYFIDDDPVLSENLQYVFVPRVSKGTCRRYYKYRYSVTDHQLCYGFENGGKDSCKGDSGGPLIKNSTVIGITSWGAECGEPDSPGVYTDVLSVLDWIKNKTKLN
ncbi:trypsin-7 isoform X1 [Lasioglossum baleicum]|uniref:trypsin-7 isoform X1 n=1 Tax=Lasioglossum baleicum TaxID=434251 RepID=UPI003FCE384A